jgi:hypothetical protein
LRRTGATTIGVGDANDLNPAHLLCGPQHIHDHMGGPSVTLCQRARMGQIAASTQVEDLLILVLSPQTVPPVLKWDRVWRSFARRRRQADADG